MKMKQCPEGHVFDPAKTTACPVCPIPGVNMGGAAGPGAGKTRPDPQPAAPPPPPPPREQPRPARPKTVAFWNLGGSGSTADAGAAGGGAVGAASPSPRVGLDPVVGWLVAVEGPAMGRDFRIRVGNNSIGRSPSQEVFIEEDSAIHGERHASVTFDPRTQNFYLRPGENRNLVYVNDELALTPVTLQAYDSVHLGSSKLVFVPLCGASFEWKLNG